ncbi:hypothetical protein [Corynebacterium gerontici]|uniref:Uncharacterized protein n=1 Tax=Corynebacterium gerontici TaxID=2079234 RepID=A0A3G6J6B7_9CORY|nr:hypothetical protein [Corynebacterium gerontici]AZA11990.1 hypothetical protein CGERO_08495 [Corynebacterium gerontici]
MEDSQEQPHRASGKRFLLTSALMLVTAAISVLFFSWLDAGDRLVYFNPISASALLSAIIFFVLGIKKLKLQEDQGIG